ncbi:unnamed protein product, partial [Polarella glacialis]
VQRRHDAAAVYAADDGEQCRLCTPIVAFDDLRAAEPFHDRQTQCQHGACKDYSQSAADATASRRWGLLCGIIFSSEAAFAAAA